MDETNGIALPETIKEIEEKEKIIRERENYHFEKNDIDFNNILNTDLSKDNIGNSNKENDFKNNNDVKFNINSDNSYVNENEEEKNGKENNKEDEKNEDEENKKDN